MRNDNKNLLSTERRIVKERTDVFWAFVVNCEAFTLEVKLKFKSVLTKKSNYSDMSSLSVLFLYVLGQNSNY